MKTAIDKLNALSDTYFVQYNDNEIMLPQKLADVLDVPVVSSDVKGVMQRLLPFNCFFWIEEKSYSDE